MDAQIPPPLPPDRSTTWWQRNWKWFVPTCLGAVVLFTGLILLIVAVVFGMLKSAPCNRVQAWVKSQQVTVYGE